MGEGEGEGEGRARVRVRVRGSILTTTTLASKTRTLQRPHMATPHRPNAPPTSPVHTTLTPDATDQRKVGFVWNDMASRRRSIRGDEGALPVDR